MDKLQSKLQDHDRETQQAADDFHTKLERIIRTVERSLLTWLVVSLAVKNGHVLSNAANLKVINSISDRVSDLMLTAGLNEALFEFNGNLQDQQGFFEQILTASGYSEKLLFTAEEEKFFTAYRESKSQDVITEALAIARRAALHGELSIGGLMEDLTQSVGEELSTIPGRLRTVASTALSMYYRTVADEGYQKIEAQTPLRFVYMGPPANDPKIRPFCEKLMTKVSAGRTWTRAEIDQMDNGQLPNVFVTCGGYACRHQWIMATKEL